MSIFGKIKDAIFGRKPPAAPAPKPAAPINRAPGEVPVPTPAPPRTATATLSEVDVEANLRAMPDAGELNWQSSIVDLMKLVGIDPSFENRKELAQELGDADYSGKAEENIALHKAVMRGLVLNGGKVPAAMLD